MATFELQKFDPCPPSSRGVFDDGAESGTQLLALDIQSKYLFVDETGDKYHEYFVPGTPDIQNCGGYVDKVILYRDPALYEFLCIHGVSRETFARPEFPILHTRSPKLDLALFSLIRHLRARPGAGHVSLLDHGCTVAEHYDLLDAMLRAHSEAAESAQSALAYCGLDKSAMLLSIARLLHPDVPDRLFRIIQAEGSDFHAQDGEFDLSLTVGVVNHVANPRQALKKLLMATRFASVMALWVTTEKEGFWAVNHSGVPTYFFSRSDLATVQPKRKEGQFYSMEYVPEDQSSQTRSYVGLGEERLMSLGSYHLVFSTLKTLPFAAEVLDL